MASERCELLREGFLDVKFPPDSPERVLHKAWRKSWIRALVLQPLKREPSLILEVGKGSLKVSRDGLQLFRCRSGSRPLQTWALSSGTSLIVYLAAESEQETQSWMQTIRDGLWPPIHTMTEKYHDISLIDDERTFSTGILGLYGRLVKTSDGMISIIHPHWQGILLRWKHDDVANIQLVRKVGDEASDSGVFKITLKSSKTETRTFYFYSNTATSAIEWLLSNSTDSKELSRNKNLQITNEQSHSHEECAHENSESSVYATVKKISKQADNMQEVSTDTDCSQNRALSDKWHSRHFLSTNISSDLLDASLNFEKLPRPESSQNDGMQSSAKNDDDSGDDSLDVYEHVYEIMNTKTSRSPTVYEEVQNTESDYVPPLPPPLPTEKPRVLRLLKLSESVADALKAVQDHPSQAIDKNSKSLRDISVKERSPRISEIKHIVRRSSEPNVSR